MSSIDNKYKKRIYFQPTTVLSILIVLLGMIDCSQTASIKNKDDLFNLTILMPNFNTTQEDQYAFLKYELPDEELTIVGYSPMIDMNAAHHMLTHACTTAGSDQQTWLSGQACGGGEQVIIHGWARNAPSMILPDDVGFPVGRNTPYKFIVLNIHYLAILRNDKSGNQLLMSRKPRKYQAGVMLGGTSQIYLKPKSHTVRAHFSCHYNGPPLSIFAARVHAHQWARVNSLYRVRDGVISQVVKGDPQWPQSFYPLASPVDIQDGDYLVGQCVYDNDDDRVIRVGPTHNDEMCNVYAMYSFEPETTTNGKQKTGSTPFRTCWDNQQNQLISLIPPDSEVPPRKPADIGGRSDGHHAHAEHAMVPSAGIAGTGKHLSSSSSSDDPAYDDYIEEVENMRHRNKGTNSFELNKILSHLGLPDYEYVDAQNYDYLLPNHLTYGKDQTVKLHNAKLMSSEKTRCRVSTTLPVILCSIPCLFSFE
jgi:peptidylglycine monooxygenase